MIKNMLNTRTLLIELGKGTVGTVGVTSKGPVTPPGQKYVALMNLPEELAVPGKITAVPTKGLLGESRLADFEVLIHCPSREALDNFIITLQQVREDLFPTKERAVEIPD